MWHSPKQDSHNRGFYNAKHTVILRPANLPEEYNEEQETAALEVPAREDNETVVERYASQIEDTIERWHQRL